MHTIEVRRLRVPYLEMGGGIFLSRMESVAPMPVLPFSPASSVFACVPLYDELGNAKRLFDSWYSQILPEGLHGEVVFLINNRETADEGIHENNRKTFELLKRLSEDNTRSDLGIHVVDKFSAGNALTHGTAFGDIRNLALVPVIRHALITGMNGIVLSSDADHFPSAHMMASLHQVYKKMRSVYGSVESEIEFSSEFSPRERKLLDDIILTNLVGIIMTEYLSNGEWNYPDIMGGANTFYSIDVFLNVGGYTEDPDMPEDVDMARRLRHRYPRAFAHIDSASLRGIMRTSDRLVGDGSELQKIIDGGYRASFSANTILLHQGLRRWLMECMAAGMPYSEGRDRLELDELFAILDEGESRRLKAVLNDPEGSDDEERYYAVYEELIRVLYSGFRIPVSESIESIGRLAYMILGDDPHFRELIAEYSRSDAADIYAPLLALRQYALERELEK
jgi:hypothetical protein